MDRLNLKEENAANTGEGVRQRGSFRLMPITQGTAIKWQTHISKPTSACSVLFLQQTGNSRLMG